MDMYDTAKSGMSPRKTLAATGSGDFGVGKMGVDKMHPDAKMDIGRKGAMADSERAAKPNIGSGKGMMSAQAAPDHGPHDPGGYDFSRGGKV